MSLLDKLPDECTIQKKIRTNDSVGGGFSSDPETVQSGVECWEQPASAKEIQLYEKRGMSVSRKVYFVANPNVTEQHEIVITKKNGTVVSAADQLQLDVVSDSRPDASAGLGILFRVMCNTTTGERS